MVVELAISGVEEKLTIRKGAIPSWDRLGEEGEPSWRWEILRGIPTSPNVTYLLAKEGNTGIHLRLCVPWLFLYPSLLSFVIAIELEVFIISCYHLLFIYIYIDVDFLPRVIAVHSLPTVG